MTSLFPPEGQIIDLLVSQRVLSYEQIIAAAHIAYEVVKVNRQRTLADRPTKLAPLSASR